ncbi:unnamed protein product [Calypogeia fissa]
MAPNEESDTTTVRKQGWVDKLMDKKGKRKYNKDDNASSYAQMDDLVKQVTGNNAPEKLIVKTKPKLVSFQGKFEKDAMDAVQDLVDQALDKGNQRKGTTGKGRGKRGAPKGSKGQNTAAKPRAPRAIKTRQAPPFPVEAIKTRQAPPFPVEAIIDQCSQSGTLQGPLTPLQTNVISNIRIGSSQVWGMFPEFNIIMEALSAGGKENAYSANSIVPQ